MYVHVSVCVLCDSFLCSISLLLLSDSLPFVLNSVRYGSQKVPVSFFIKTVFILATETERLGHGTVRSMVN